MKIVVSSLSKRLIRKLKYYKLQHIYVNSNFKCTFWLISKLLPYRMVRKRNVENGFLGISKQTKHIL